MYTEEQMVWLGFSKSEIGIAIDILRQNGGRDVKADTVVRYFNTDYNTAARVRYLITLIIGKKVINIAGIRYMDDLKPLAKHFEYINGSKYPATTINRLMPSRVANVPKIAIIRGIEYGKYSVFNSENPTDINSYYVVDKITASDIVVRAKKSVVLEYDRTGQYGIDGVIKVLGKDTKRRTVLQVNKNFCRLCNRYVIVASLRKPSNHLGAYGMITVGGDIVYVYAKSVDGNRSIAKSSTERIYDWGIMKQGINEKLKRVAIETYKELGCIYQKRFAQEEEFTVCPRKVEECSEIEV